MLLQVLFKVEGFPTGRLRAAKRLLVDMLVLLVVIQILPVGEDPSTAREVTGHQLSLGSFPNSPEPNLGSILITSRIQSRLGLTPRAVQRLSHLQFCRHLRGPAEFQLHLSI